VVSFPLSRGGASSAIHLLANLTKLASQCGSVAGRCPAAGRGWPCWTSSALAHVAAARGRFASHTAAVGLADGRRRSGVAQSTDAPVPARESHDQQLARHRPDVALQLCAATSSRGRREPGSRDARIGGTSPCPRPRHDSTHTCSMDTTQLPPDTHILYTMRQGIAARLFQSPDITSHRLTV
jgi:hypothetical protein